MRRVLAIQRRIPRKKVLVQKIMQTRKQDEALLTIYSIILKKEHLLKKILLTITGSMRMLASGVELIIVVFRNQEITYIIPALYYKQRGAREQFYR
jgi:hypothetical protein